MKKDELLTKLALEYQEWSPRNFELPSAQWYVGYNYFTGEELICACLMQTIDKKSWKARRLELINEPDDKYAPEWAEWVFQLKNGKWAFSQYKPIYDDNLDEWVSPLVGTFVNWTNQGTIPAGHDWRKTLRRVKRKEGFKACIQDTNTRHEHDPVNHPKHYKLFPDLESIDVIQRSLTEEQFAGFCMGNALKYRLRAGEKGDASEDLAKANWYRDKLAELSDE